MEAETLAMAQEIDFSLWALFARATLIVKLVMLMLIVASFWAWSIIIQKTITYRKARAEAAFSVTGDVNCQRTSSCCCCSIQLVTLSSVSFLLSKLFINHLASCKCERINWLRRLI